MSERNHDLDCWPTYYDAVVSGVKTYEVRKNDRFFQTGDLVTLHRLCEDKPHDWFYNPRKECVKFRIGGMLQGGQFGIEPGYCVFSLVPINPAPPQD